MDITVNDPSLTYSTTGISIKKITISSISIDPLKRIANFIVSYWNGAVFLGNESYTYKATYAKKIELQPVLKSLSVPSTTSYTIIISATIGGTSYTIPSFTSLFPYLTSGLQIYYSQIDPSIISLESSTGISTLTTASYAYGGNVNGIDMLSIFYTVGDAQYNVKIAQPAQSKLCHGGITTLYTNSGNSSLSLTTDPINFNIPVPIGTNTLNVQSEPNTTTVSNASIQTNIYNGYEATPIYKSVSALPTLSIYYNPNNISDISATSSIPYTANARNLFFTSVTFKSNNSYQFSNLSYTAVNTNGTSVIVTFQSKQLTITSLQIEPAQINYNPLNTSDIGFQDDTNKNNYDNLINIMSTTPTPTSGQFSTLIETFNTTKNKIVTFDSKGTPSIQ